MTFQPSHRLTNCGNILIVDDHPMMRAGLAARITDESDLEVCGEAEDVAGALSAVDSLRPDLAIIDISLKEGHGIDLVKEIKTRFPKVKMLVLSAYKESLYAERALRAGALGYLNKQESDDNILEAIRTVLAGERYVSEEMTKRLLGQAIGAGDPSVSPVETLSDRELEVFQLLGKGITTGAIARQLHLSPHTIDTHREKIKQTRQSLADARKGQSLATSATGAFVSNTVRGRREPRTSSPAKATSTQIPTGSPIRLPGVTSIARIAPQVGKAVDDSRCSFKPPAIMMLLKTMEIVRSVPAIPAECWPIDGQCGAFVFQPQLIGNDGDADRHEQPIDDADCDQCSPRSPHLSSSRL